MNRPARWPIIGCAAAAIAVLIAALCASAHVAAGDPAYRAENLWGYRMPSGERLSHAVPVDGVRLPDGSMLLTLMEGEIEPVRAYRLDRAGRLLWRSEELDDGWIIWDQPDPGMMVIPTDGTGSASKSQGGSAVVATTFGYLRLPLHDAPTALTWIDSGLYVVTGFAVGGDGSVWLGGGEDDINRGWPGGRYGPLSTKVGVPCSRAIVARFDEADRLLWRWRFGGYERAAYARQVLPLSGGGVLVRISNQPPSYTYSGGSFPSDCRTQRKRQWLAWLDATGRLLRSVEIEPGDVQEMALLPDGRVILARVGPPSEVSDGLSIRILDRGGQKVLADARYDALQVGTTKPIPGKPDIPTDDLRRVGRIVVQGNRIYVAVEFDCQRPCPAARARLIELDERGRLQRVSIPWEAGPVLGILPDASGFLIANEYGVHRVPMP